MYNSKFLAQIIILKRKDRQTNFPIYIYLDIKGLSIQTNFWKRLLSCCYFSYLDKIKVIDSFIKHILWNNYEKYTKPTEKIYKSSDLRLINMTVFAYRT